MHRVVALALPDVVAFDLSIAAQVFGSRSEGMYEFTLCAAAPGPLPTTTGFALLIERDLSALDDADTVVVPGYEDLADALPDDVIAALRRAHDRGARMVSICTGAFALAAAGLLDGLVRRRTGNGRGCWPGATPTSTSRPTSCTSTKDRS